MPPPKTDDERFRDLERQIILLSGWAQDARAQIKDNTDDCRRNREDTLILKTKAAFVSAGIAVIISGIVSLVVATLVAYIKFHP